MSYMRWIKKQFWLWARFGLYQAMNMLWFVILLPLCIALKWSGCPLFGYIFLVYPGALDQVRGYMPQWYRKIIPIISIIGIISRGKQGKRGLVVMIPWTITEVEEGNRLEVIVRRVNKLAKSIGAKSIALAGRIPGVLKQNGYFSLLSPPIVVGDKGAVYTITLSIKQITEALGISISKITIGILGHGFIGSRLVNSLHYFSTNKIVVVDPRIKQERNDYDKVILSSDPAKLANCDLVVILTAGGEQAECAIEYLKPCVIIVDDTHPQLPHRLSRLIEKKGGRVVKAVLGLEGVAFWPRLPNWRANWLPGCCMEGFVSATKGFAFSQQEFNQLAHEIRFKALDVSNINEL